MHLRKPTADRFEALQVEAEEQLRETRNGKQFKCVRCQSWRSFSKGHSEGNECIYCWKEIEDKIVAFIAERSWRSEDVIVDYMCKQESILTPQRVESWLAELVEVDGSLVWFGPSEEKVGSDAYCNTPLKYRFVPKDKRKAAHGISTSRKRRQQRNRNTRIARRAPAKKRTSRLSQRSKP